MSVKAVKKSDVREGEFDRAGNMDIATAEAIVGDDSIGDKLDYEVLDEQENDDVDLSAVIQKVR